MTENEIEMFGKIQTKADWTIYRGFYGSSAGKLVLDFNQHKTEELNFFQSKITKFDLKLKEISLFVDEKEITTSKEKL